MPPLTNFWLDALESVAQHIDVITSGHQVLQQMSGAGQQGCLLGQHGQIVVIHQQRQFVALRVTAHLDQCALESLGHEHLLGNEAMMVLVPQLVVVLQIDGMERIIVTRPEVAAIVVKGLLEGDLAVLGEPPQRVVHIEEYCLNFVEHFLFI